MPGILIVIVVAAVVSVGLLAMVRHTSPERMVLVSGELHVTYEGQEPTVQKTGMCAYGPAELPHSANGVSSVPRVLSANR
jgi:mannose-6-phosphate isomerase-like protein (cupin superfamily)